jgi:phosphopantetheine--protein transferase-like protein
MYEIKVGNDIVYVPRFKKKMASGKICDKLFHKTEMKNNSVEHLAGIFALKESCIKALALPIGSWLSMEVKKMKTGKPHIKFEKQFAKKIISQDCSISHDGDYVIAQVVFLLEK